MTEVRRMSAGDLPAIEKIYGQHLREEPPRSWLTTVARLIDDPAKLPLAWVATDQGKLVGYIVGEVRSWEFGSSPAGWVIGIGVDQEFRGDGVGRALIVQLLRAFAARNARTVRTMVYHDDISVLRFFRSAGFTTGPYTQLEITLEPNE